jgi:hypothetical protein
MTTNNTSILLSYIDEDRPSRSLEILHKIAALRSLGNHPDHPEATYCPHLSSEDIAGYSDKNNKHYYISRRKLPKGHPNKVYAD